MLDGDQDLLPDRAEAVLLAEPVEAPDQIGRQLQGVHLTPP
ncbi:MAG TPA: hypothetical protein VK689_21595 [Armatimonadota bacterium]|nr:hypothetical protein [Armatimonadota bacterium]